MSLARTLKNSEGSTPLEVYDWHIQQMAANQQSRHDTDGHFHVSQISGLCARKLVLNFVPNPDTGKLAKVKKVRSAAEERRLRAGHFGHIRTQIDCCAAGLMLRKESDIKLAAAREKEMFAAYYRDPPRYLPQVWKYCRACYEIEGAVSDTELNIAGSFDGIMVGPNGKQRLFEFKTWNEFQWSSLISPITEHEVQATIYATLSKVRQMIFWYEEPGGTRIREFVLRRDPDMWEDAKRVIKKAQRYIELGDWPKQSYTDPKAFACTWCGAKQICHADKLSRKRSA